MLAYVQVGCNVSPGLQSPSPTKSSSAVELRYIIKRSAHERSSGYSRDGGGTFGTQSLALVELRFLVVKPIVQGMHRSLAGCAVLESGE